jgi:hypothetical protein
VLPLFNTPPPPTIFPGDKGGSLEDRVQEGNILQKKERKAKWIGHIWHRNCLLKHVTEGKIEERIEVK